MWRHTFALAECQAVYAGSKVFHTKAGDGPLAGSALHAIVAHSAVEFAGGSHVDSLASSVLPVKPAKLAGLWRMLEKMHVLLTCY
jgi:hypothetical protein